MEYYPIVKKWRRIKSAIALPEIQDVLVQDFNKYTYGRGKYKFEKGQMPIEYESCDWAVNKRGRQPEFWNYVKHGACHWLVNFNLAVAMKVEPKKQWRIVTSQKHSTVWDGESTLFDFNFCALGIPPDEAFHVANKRQLKLGQKLKVHFVNI